MSIRVRTLVVLAGGVLACTTLTARRARQRARRDDALWAAASEALAPSQR